MVLRERFLNLVYVLRSGMDGSSGLLLAMVTKQGPAVWHVSCTYPVITNRVLMLDLLAMF